MAKSVVKLMIISKLIRFWSWRSSRDMAVNFDVGKWMGNNLFFFSRNKIYFNFEKITVIIVNN